MQVIKFILTYYWIIRLAVNIVEEAADGWSSAEKKDAAIRTITTLAEKFNVRLPQAFLDNLGDIIDAIVAVFNALGVFRKREQDPKAEQPAQ
jgi:hypothetical protein